MATRRHEYRHAGRKLLANLAGELQGVDIFGNSFLETFADYEREAPDAAARFAEAVEALKANLKVLTQCKDTVKMLQSLF
jgi:hypothetical protein